jgi:hypothetical protein
MQVPGINPEWLARQMLSRMDDRASMDEAMAQGVPSIMALNAAMRAGGQGASPEQPNPAGAPGPAGPGGEQPNAQGAEGANNAPKPAGQGGAAPRPPAPRPGMAPGNGPMLN